MFKRLICPISEGTINGKILKKHFNLFNILLSKNNRKSMDDDKT